MARGRTEQTKTSASRHSAVITARPDARLASTAMLRLERLECRKIAPMPRWRSGPMLRARSPAGGSTLTMSAPRSPRIWVQYGPISTLVMSTMRTPASGPAMLLAPAAYGLLGGQFLLERLQHLAALLAALVEFGRPLLADLAHRGGNLVVLGLRQGHEFDAGRFDLGAVDAGGFLGVLAAGLDDLLADFIHDLAQVGGQRVPLLARHREGGDEAAEVLARRRRAGVRRQVVRHDRRN